MSRVVDALMSRVAFWGITIFAASFLVYDIGQSLTYGVALRCWNWPNISITFALILALYLARQIDDRMREALHELWLQGTLPEPVDPRTSLQERILQGRAHKEALSALLIMAVMIA